MEEISKLSVLMPVHNEARTLRTIVRRVLGAPVDLDIELIAVDDGSADDSWHLLQELAAADERIRVFQHPENRGKGAAVRTAIEHMTGEVAIVQDSDLEYDPADFPRLLRPILEGRAEAVFGSRFASSPERRVLMFWHSLGNRFLTLAANAFNDLNLTDMETCYKVVRADVLRSLRLQSNRFGIEPELTTRLAQAGARIYEVPISYHGRTYAEGKSIGWRDGVQAVWLLFKYRFLDTRFADHEGHATLESLRMAPAVNRWLLAQFEPYLGQRVLEAGCGIGNLTSLLLKRERLISVDIDQYYTERLERRYGHLENVSILTADLEDRGLYAKLGEDRIDSILCVNVLEHVDAPHEVVARFADLLPTGGIVGVLVPAHQWLYSATDQAIGHRKRYSIDEVRDLLDRAGFEVLRVAEFNRLGVAGWLVNKALGRTTISKMQARIYGWMIPIARIVERVAPLPGLSVVAVGRRR